MVAGKTPAGPNRSRLNKSSTESIVPPMSSRRFSFGVRALAVLTLSALLVVVLGPTGGLVADSDAPDPSEEPCVGCVGCVSREEINDEWAGITAGQAGTGGHIVVQARQHMATATFQLGDRPVNTQRRSEIQVGRRSEPSVVPPDLCDRLSGCEGICGW